MCAAWNHVFKCKQLVKVRWNKPKDGWYKLNMDGSSFGNPVVANGGVIHDHRGLWIVRALWDGITICINLNLS